MTYVYIAVKQYGRSRGYFSEWDMSYPARPWFSGRKQEYEYDAAMEICEMLRQRGYETKLEPVPANELNKE